MASQVHYNKRKTNPDQFQVNLKETQVIILEGGHWVYYDIINKNFTRYLDKANYTNIIPIYILKDGISALIDLKVAPVFYKNGTFLILPYVSTLMALTSNNTLGQCLSETCCSVNTDPDLDEPLSGINLQVKDNTMLTIDTLSVFLQSDIFGGIRARVTNRLDSHLVEIFSLATTKLSKRPTITFKVMDRIDRFNNKLFIYPNPILSFYDDKEDCECMKPLKTFKRYSHWLKIKNPEKTLPQDLVELMKSDNFFFTNASKSIRELTAKKPIGRNEFVGTKMAYSYFNGLHAFLKENKSIKMESVHPVIDNIINPNFNNIPGTICIIKEIIAKFIYDVTEINTIDKLQDFRKTYIPEESTYRKQLAIYWNRLRPHYLPAHGSILRFINMYADSYIEAETKEKMVFTMTLSRITALKFCMYILGIATAEIIFADHSAHAVLLNTLKHKVMEGNVKYEPEYETYSLYFTKSQYEELCRIMNVKRHYEILIINYICDQLNSIILSLCNIPENKLRRDSWVMPSIPFKIFYNLLSDELNKRRKDELFFKLLWNKIKYPDESSSDIHIIKDALMTTVKENRETIIWRNFPICGTDIGWTERFLHKRKVDVLRKLTKWMSTPILLREASHQTWDPMYTTL